MNNNITNSEIEMLELIDSLQRQLHVQYEMIDTEARTRIKAERRFMTVLTVFVGGWLATTMMFALALSGRL